MKSLLLVAGALLAPTIAHADGTVVVAQQPQPTVVTEPQGTEVYDSYNAPIFTTGALVFAASYGASVAVAASNDDDSNGLHHLYVPVVGPWLALNDRPDCDAVLSRCDNETSKKVLLVADGIFQAAGIITMLDGLIVPSHHRVIATTAKIDAKLHHPRPIALGPDAAPGLGF